MLFIHNMCKEVIVINKTFINFQRKHTNIKHLKELVFNNDLFIYRVEKMYGNPWKFRKVSDTKKNYEGQIFSNFQRGI